MVGKRARLEILGTVIAVGAIAALSVIAITRSDGPTTAASAAGPSAEAPSPTVSVSPVQLARVGGLPIAIPDRTLDDPRLMPYPFMSPTPPPGSSVLDGTYLRTIDLDQIGGARIGLPYRCFRCPPYRVDAGVSTLMFLNGAYYLHHHLSGFRTMGSFVIEDDTITLFNDANCPQTPGVYRFVRTSHGLRFTVVEDDCPYSNERAKDLMFEPWIHVSACVRRIQNLWPGEYAC
jgi:hypothetical protein